MIFKKLFGYADLVLKLHYQCVQWSRNKL